MARMASLTLTGTGATVVLASTGAARFMAFDVPTANSAGIRVGGSDTTVSVGFPIAKGTQYNFPILAADGREATVDHLYEFSKTYVYIANNDVVTVVYAL